MGSRSASTLQQTLYRSPIIHIQRTIITPSKWERTYSTASVIAHKGKESNECGARHPSTEQPTTPQASGLERLPTWSLVRNLMLGSMFTSPLLFRVGFGMLDKIANSKSSLLNPDSNPILRAVVKPLIYDQFCAGTNQREIFKTRDFIRGMGYAGVILCYGKEIQISKSNELKSTGFAQNNEIQQWKEGNLETLNMVGEGDWLGIKLTGAGTNVTNALMKNETPSADFIAAMDAICARAAAQKCRLWIDAEQQVCQTAIDRWTIDLMRKWNTNGRALVYNTLQAYLKASRPKLQHQLALADREGWTLAVKLVRGAYIANDQREKIHDTKPETDASYDGIVQDLLQGTNLGFDEANFPRMQLFLAGHNPDSVARAWTLTQSLSEQNRLKVLPDFGQLQGMADELGCKLLQRCDDVKSQSGGDGEGVVVVPKVYRCLTWGSIQECMQYLLRRLVENRGGADRMRDGMADYWAELKRRTLGRSSV
ncbi:related to proline oxidase Put1 [Lecanosticta acicola]|uniref:Proline dehydrogenase n=1 Tax=Lecanosticta acicola TaxID=111012 RepID=A0AAI8Z137_9PEZI|nr:related to proline oxidase Put1 [Lecanosticta acicola]